MGRRLARDFAQSVAEDEFKERVLGRDVPTNPGSIGGVAGSMFHKMFVSRQNSSAMSPMMLQHRATTKGMTESFVKDRTNRGKLNPNDALRVRNKDE